MADQSPAFTASRIAELLGQDRKTVREQLDPSQARKQISRGQPAHAWPVEALPAPLRTRLEAVAQAQGHKDVIRFLEKGRTRWQPGIPVGKIAVPFVERAQKRCAVCAPLVRAHRDEPISQLASLAQRAWQASAGNPISNRTARRWIERAIERDRGFEDWDRWAIWLDDDIAALPPARPAEAAEVLQMPALEHAINAVAKPSEPTSDEREGIWLGAMTDADSLEAQGATAAIVQELTLAVLGRAGIPLAKNQEALRVAFRRKRAKWIKGGRVPSCVEDRRPARNKDRRWSLPQNDRLLLARYLINCSDLASAWRMALKNKVLSPETATRFTDEPMDKSYVPTIIREAMADVVEAKAKHSIGPRAAKLAGGHIERDHSDYAPGDWWQGDDLTPPVYFWDDLGAGPFITRGQVVMMIDFRTMYPLGWVLGSAKTYNARQIRSLITRCHDEHGLPRNGFYFENGIWKSARVLKGKNDQTMIDFDETEKGLREFGLHFEHANTPRAKVIERVFGLLQNRMEHVRGYCGRNEAKDCPEHVRRAKLDVAARRCHPADHFLHKDEWAAEIDKIVADYSAEPHGPRAKMIPGQAPAEAYNARQTGDIIHLAADARYLLANHRLPLPVTRNGIRLPKSLGGGLYRGEATGPEIGRQVLAWVDPDKLETITITSLDHADPRIVDRADPIPAFTDNPAEIKAAADQLAAHNRHSANLYRVVSGGDKPPGFRPVVIDRKTLAVGTEMTRQAAEHSERVKTVANGRRFVTREAARQGLPVRAGDTPAKIERQREAAELRQQALDEIARQRAGVTEKTP